MGAMENGPYVCCIEKIRTIRKKKRMVARPNGGTEKNKIATKIRSRLEVLKKDEVKIVLVIK
jgi:hypothetical protein